MILDILRSYLLFFFLNKLIISSDKNVYGMGIIILSLATLYKRPNVRVIKGNGAIEHIGIFSINIYKRMKQQSKGAL